MSKIDRPSIPVDLIEPKLIKLVKLGFVDNLLHEDSHAGDLDHYGKMNYLPKEGECFYCLGVSLNPGGRGIRTSTVVKVVSQTEDSIEFNTLNSRYKVEFIDELPENLIQ